MCRAAFVSNFLYSEGISIPKALAERSNITVIILMSLTAPPGLGYGACVVLFDNVFDFLETTEAIR
jgi:hypothetical protein